MDGRALVRPFSRSSRSQEGQTCRVGRNVEVRVLGALPGCLAMIVASVMISVLLTLLINLGR